MDYLPKIIHSMVPLPERNGLSLRSVFGIWDDAMRYSVCYEYEQGYIDDEFSMYLRQFEEDVQKEQWTQEAKRQVFIADAKTVLRKKVPKEVTEHTVALNISPANATPEMCLSIAEIVKSLTCSLGGYYVIEQRSKDPDPPQGWHLHFYLRTTYAPSKVIQFAKQKITRKDYVATYDCKRCDENFLNKYMRGIKGNPEKDLKASYDRVIRPRYGLQDMYEF